MTAAAQAPADTWIRRHRLIFYFALTYAISWPLWLLSRLAGGTLGTALLVVGAFGPLLAAAITIRYSGGSMRSGLRHRSLAGTGSLLCVRPRSPGADHGSHERDARRAGPATGRVPALRPDSCVSTNSSRHRGDLRWAGGAGLARLRPTHVEQRYRHVATLILGFGWGVWHIPLYGPAGFVVPLVLAFFYSWLYNRTHSVLLCILLHASFTAAQDHLLLSADSRIVDAVLLGTYVVGAGVLVAVTRGRLGMPTKEADDR